MLSALSSHERPSFLQLSLRSSPFHLGPYFSPLAFPIQSRLEQRGGNCRNRLTARIRNRTKSSLEFAVRSAEKKRICMSLRSTACMQRGKTIKEEVSLEAHGSNFDSSLTSFSFPFSRVLLLLLRVAFRVFPVQLVLLRERAYYTYIRTYGCSSNTPSSAPPRSNSMKQERGREGIVKGRRGGGGRHSAWQSGTQGAYVHTVVERRKWQRDKARKLL